jgi:hypothetical protein
MGVRKIPEEFAGWTGLIPTEFGLWMGNPLS